MRIEMDYDGNAVWRVMAYDPHTNFPVGTLAFLKCEGSIYISRLRVHKGYRRRGVAESLLNFLIREFPEKAITLNVKIGNNPAQSLYKKMGFQFHGKERGSVHLPMRREAT